MLRTLVVFSILMLSITGARAQAAPVAPEDTRCWHASQSYSEGSLVRVGGKFYACGAGGSWGEAASGGANCVYEDRNYSSGALIAVKDALIECQPSGAWTAAKQE